MNSIIDISRYSSAVQCTIEKIYEGNRISEKEAIELYRCDLSLLSVLSTEVRLQKNKRYTYFNKNIHIEPTNICVYDCTFCSYKRNEGEEGVWELNHDQILDLVKSHLSKNISEIHIVGGVHPDWNLEYYGELIQKIKQVAPHIHIKGFTAIELDYMIRKSGYSLREGLLKLKEFGLQSIPGGGAEIFDEEVRREVCGEKSSSKLWLEVHQTAHECGIPSNATMLYWHIETIEHRIDHLRRLRELQDKTSGFNTFIPLKYRMVNNKLGHIGEVSVIDDLKTYAISRLYLDNFPHIKAYWPMIGMETTQIALSFGVDDIDGTIDDTTKIYSMAGVKDKQAMSSQELVDIIKHCNYTPVERDTVYNHLQEF